MKSLPTRGLGNFLLGLSLLAASCMFSPEPDKHVQGGGSDTETLTGMVLSPDASPAAHALVKLLPADYDPSHPDTARIRHAITDDSGHFRFEKLDSGQSYNLIAGKATEKSWALAAGLKAGKDTNRLSLALAKVFLFSMHAGGYQKADSGIAYFPGTDILAHCDGVHASQVDSVPMGALRFVVESRAGWEHDTTLISIGDTAKVDATKNGVAVGP